VLTLAQLLKENGEYETHLIARGVKNWRPALSSLRRNLLSDYRSLDVRKLER
jgi:hypothetical protein